MSKNTEKYKRSLYLSTAVLSNRQECVVEKVVNSFDGTVCVRRSYREDKTEIYRLLAELKSPYLPEIIEIFENDGQTEIIERYIEGETLSKLIAEGKVNKKLAKKIARQLLCALADIQKINIIHRDIKPENIIMSGDRLTLIDFGIARVYKENETRDTRHLGTEGYAAPEQYGFSQSDKRTDIFSSGKTILKVCEAAQLKGIVKRTAERCAQFDPMHRFESAKDALKFLNVQQRAFYGIAFFFAVSAMVGIFAYGLKYEKNMPQELSEEKTAQKTENSVEQKVPPKPKEQTDKSKTIKKRVVNSPAIETINTPLVKQPEKIQPEVKENIQATEAGQSRISEDAPVANYRDHSDIIFGKGKILWLLYPGNNAKAEDTFNFRGSRLKIKALLQRKVLKMKLGEQNFDIAFGNFVSNYQSDTTLLEADIYMRDIDGDGVEELFIGVRLRHGFATSSTTLWFARYTDGKFILCDSPLCFKGEHTEFNIEANNRIVTKFFGDCYHIEGYKFVRDKCY